MNESLPTTAIQILWSLLPALLLGALSAPAYGQGLSAREVMERSVENRRLEGTESLVTLTIINDRGQKRVRKMAMATKLDAGGHTEKKLARFLAPADVKGTGFLTYDHEADDDDIWLFVPALRKTRRIVSSDRAKSFMGSEFSYADINLPNLDDYRFRILGEEKIGEAVCWTIESVARNDAVAEEDGYQRKILQIGKEDFTLRRAVYFDLAGERSKELIATRVEEVDPKRGHFRAMRLEMTNEQNRRRSIMVTEAFSMTTTLGDDHFTTRYLERI